jgi:hypothetical protein
MAFSGMNSGVVMGLGAVLQQRQSSFSQPSSDAAAESRFLPNTVYVTYKPQLVPALRHVRVVRVACGSDFTLVSTGTDGSDNLAAHMCAS